MVRATGNEPASARLERRTCSSGSRTRNHATTLVGPRYWLSTSAIDATPARQESSPARGVRPEGLRSSLRRVVSVGRSRSVTLRADSVPRDRTGSRRPSAGARASPVAALRSWAGHDARADRRPHHALGEAARHIYTSEGLQHGGWCDGVVASPDSARSSRPVMLVSEAVRMGRFLALPPGRLFSTGHGGPRRPHVVVGGSRSSLPPDRGAGLPPLSVALRTSGLSKR
jgi:hypothetical protein